MQNKNKTKIRGCRKILCLIIFLGILISTPELNAQYFGKNKPSYMSFKYNVFETPHFEIYNYLKNDSFLIRLGQLSEQWYTLHKELFKDTFRNRNPIIIYNNHADFQQTNAISGLIDEGTGGVTEALKNRVVFPLAPTYAQTVHVLGHELAHAFQYHILVHGDSGNLNRLKLLPLWMMEGMAEYFSAGSLDAHTSMWMRDAIVNDEFPSIEEISRSSKYFPYRYGQCLLAMIGKTWGDSVIVPIMKETSRVGYRKALQNKLGFDEKTLSRMWKNTLVSHYQKYLDIALKKPVGNKLLFSGNAGDMNISPSVSPNGKLVIFYSEKDIYTYDLYLAVVNTGRIIRKLASTVNDSKIDAFNFIESSGSWSPDSKYFVFAVYADGRNKLAMVDIHKGRIISKQIIPGVPSFSNPVWSPNSDIIALSGMVEGQSSLFLYNLGTRQIIKLTNDSYSYIQPAWSADGKYLAFSTDKPFTGSKIDPNGAMNLGIINIETKEVRLLKVFTGAKNLNPLFLPDNKSICFLSDRDGFRNLYKYSLFAGKSYQMSELFTGISGISDYSPAISIAKDNGLLAYSYFQGGKYSVYAAYIKDFDSIEVPCDSINFDAATLPPFNRKSPDVVDNNLKERVNQHFESKDSFRIKTYHPKFQLDYISGLNAGFGTGQFGAGIEGSIYAIFSDITGQNQIFSSVSINGEIYDYAGVVSYINSKHHINWGASISHTPYLYGYQGSVKDTLIIGNVKTPVNNYPLYVERVFEDKFSLFIYKAFTQTRRIEAGISSSWNYYRLELYNNYFTENGNPVESNMQVAPVPNGYILHSLNVAYVNDNSYFGMTGPAKGSRSRFEIETYFGGIDYSTVLIDYRKYFYLKPYTIAIRGLLYGQYGSGSEDSRLPAFYLGYPWYLRGYDINTFKDISSSDTGKLSINDLAGSRIAVANIEYRVPFTGTKNVTLIKTGFLNSDLIFFFDAGIAWQNGTTLTLKWKPGSPVERTPLMSTGVSIRVNILNYVVLEPYLAFPLQFGGLKNPVFGLNFLPGW